MSPFKPLACSLLQGLASSASKPASDLPRELEQIPAATCARLLLSPYLLALWHVSCLVVTWEP